MQSETSIALRCRSQNRRRLLPGASRQTEQTSRIPSSMRMVWVEPGAFAMGSPAGTGWAEESPQHTVQITRAFLISNHEVTQPQYRAVVAGDSRSLNDPDALPVNEVSWFDAIDFCNTLSIKEHRAPYYQVTRQGDTAWVRINRVDGPGYRLPTEAEWEYACRAGSKTRFPFGDDPAALGAYAWFNGNSQERIHHVGQKRPSAWGLYDMLGNACGNGARMVTIVATINNRRPPDPVGPGNGRVAGRSGAGAFSTTRFLPTRELAEGHPPDTRWGTSRLPSRCIRRRSSGFDGVVRHPPSGRLGPAERTRTTRATSAARSVCRVSNCLHVRTAN